MMTNQEGEYVRNSMKTAVIVWIQVLALAVVAVGQPIVSGPDLPATGYQPIKTWYEQSAATGPTAQQKMGLLREVVRRGPGGQRLLDRMFKNFEGPGAFDPGVPGSVKNLLLTASDSLAQRKGASRTHVYATRAHHDPRFSLLAVDEATSNIVGKTDKDIVLRHLATGGKVRIESKDLKPSSQRADLPRLKRQIDKMAAEWRATGELQALVNRRTVIPQLKQYARQRGIPVFENVVTSERGLTSGQMHFDQVLDILDRTARWQTRIRLASAGLESGLGALIIIHAAPQIYSDVSNLMDQETPANVAWLRLGEHGQLALGGGIMVTSGGINLAAHVSQRASQAVVANRYLRAVGRWGGWVGIGVAVLSDAWVIEQYRGGYIGRREFWTSQASLVGGLAGGIGGGYAGAWAGAGIGGSIGLFVGGPPGAGLGAAIGAFAGGIGGGVGGGYLGATLVAYPVEAYYDFSDERVERQFEEFLYSCYGAN